MNNVKYKFELKFIHLETFLSLLPLEFAQKCQRCRLCVFTEISRSELGFWEILVKFCPNHAGVESIISWLVHCLGMLAKKKNSDE